MASRRIKQLFEKYWEGSLEQQEEEELQHLLISHKDSIEPEMEQLSNWFEANKSLAESLTLSEEFDEQVLNQIHKREGRSDHWNWWKIAASVTVVVGLGILTLFLPISQKNEMAANTQESPEKAYLEAKATLQLMATVMNQGKEHLGSLEMLNTAQQKVKNTFQPSNENSTKKNKDS